MTVRKRHHFLLKKSRFCSPATTSLFGTTAAPGVSIAWLKASAPSAFQSGELEAIDRRFVQFTPFNDALEKERFIGPPSMHTTPLKFNIAPEK